MSAGSPFPSRPDLQWQIVLINPRLLRAVQRRLRSTGPSHAIEMALELALRGADDKRAQQQKSTQPH